MVLPAAPRGVDAALPLEEPFDEPFAAPKMSLLPPPGGLRTLQINTVSNLVYIQLNCHKIIFLKNFMNDI